MTEIDRCLLLDVTTGLCKGISWNIFDQPTQMETFGWNRGMCKAKRNIAEQAGCAAHPQHQEWIEVTKDDGSNTSQKIIVSKR